MPSESAQRLSAYVIAFGAVITAVALAVWTGAAAWSVGVGAVVAVVNWYLLKWIVTRVVDGGTTSKGGFIALLFLKLGGLFFGIGALLLSGLVQPIPFALGVSALPFGLLVGSFHYVISQQSMESEH